jgi:NADPH-dependent glutamate synthase beta subunit-like oxidoreductase
VDHELGEPLPELVQGLLRVDVEVPDEVDDQERGEEEAVRDAFKAELKKVNAEAALGGPVRANMADYKTSRPNVFSAGDMRRGQSLVVWAIREGRLCARAIDQYLMGTTTLPR